MEEEDGEKVEGEEDSVEFPDEMDLFPGLRGAQFDSGESDQRESATRGSQIADSEERMKGFQEGQSAVESVICG